jgi:hypothetical protein
LITMGENDIIEGLKPHWTCDFNEAFNLISAGQRHSNYTTVSSPLPPTNNGGFYMPTPLEKVCSTCKYSLPFTNFHKDKSKKDGYFTICKACRKLSSKNYYDSNKEKLSLKAKEYRETHKEVLSAKSYEYRKLNTEKIKSFQENYRNNNRAKLNQAAKLYNATHKEKIHNRYLISKDKNKAKKSEYMRAYYSATREKKIAYQKEYYFSKRDLIRKRLKDNAQAISAKRAAHRLANLDTYKEQGKLSYLRNYQRIMECKVRYRINNAEKLRAYRKANLDKSRIHGQSDLDKKFTGTGTGENLRKGVA